MRSGTSLEAGTPELRNSAARLRSGAVGSRIGHRRPLSTWLSSHCRRHVRQLKCPNFGTPGTPETSVTVGIAAPHPVRTRRSQARTHDDHATRERHESPHQHRQRGTLTDICVWNGQEFSHQDPDDTVRPSSVSSTVSRRPPPRSTATRTSSGCCTRPSTSGTRRRRAPTPWSSGRDRPSVWSSRTRRLSTS
jgi:hypothetical protein